MGKVPDHVIAEIRDRTDLVEMIGAYVQLKRSGRNWLGLCPFHQEKTPSFNVSPERGIYHCFGCGVTGDSIKFLMEYDHVSFPEALKELAGRVGIDLAPYEGRSAARGDDFDLLYRAHAIAERLYRKALAGPEGKAARAEIARRGLSDEIVEEYRLGASPDAWDRVLTACAKDGVPAAVVERAGLALARRTDGGAAPGHYDRFRGRLMFPIAVAGGKVIGFGGRVLGDGEPKYLNSPESPLFRKRKTLYGIPQAQAAIRESRSAILVEGYTDALALANAGIRGCLAALGTAFTTEHAAWLSRSCDRVTVLFDGDEAGRKAAVASCGPLLGAGLEVGMVMLPAGEDPDSFLRRQGADALRERLGNAGGVLDTLLGDEAYGEGAGRERALRRALGAIAPIGDELRRRIYLEDLSSRVGLPLPLLEEQLEALRRREADRERRLTSRGSGAGVRSGSPDTTSRPAPAARVSVAGEQPPPPDVEPVGDDESVPGFGFEGSPGSAGDDVPDGLPEGSALPAAEKAFVGILLHSESHGEALLEHFGPEEFRHPVVRRVVGAAARMLAEGRTPGPTSLLDALAGDEAAVGLVGRLAVSKTYVIEIDRQSEDCRSRLQHRALSTEMNRIMTEMRKAKALGDNGLVLDCARRRNEIARQIAGLNAPRETY